jgi:two-component sensor histidine kinase
MDVEANTDAEGVEQLLATPGLADALESDRFKQFLDHVPVAIAVSDIGPLETIFYCNLEFERLTGQPASIVQGHDWKVLPGMAAAQGDDTSLSEAVQTDDEYVGTFTIDRDGDCVDVDAWSNTIESDDGVPMFRLVALARIGQRDPSASERYAQLLGDKDVLLRELQHRVKNNLQMITALIRMEARNVPDGDNGERFDRLAGRVQALAILYDLLAGEGAGDGIDLGVYLSQVATAVMQAHSVEGIRLNLNVDTWPVSINVAMPAGLVVNELMTNALKHAFVGRDGGTISLSSLVTDTGCRVVIADDGVGLPAGESWPQSGKLSAVIAQSLKQNAKAQMEVQSRPGQGLHVAIIFSREAAEPDLV